MGLLRGQDRPVRSDTAVTGEITLRGHILPVGGIRDKAMFFRSDELFILEMVSEFYRSRFTRVSAPGPGRAQSRNPARAGALWQPEARALSR